MLILSSSRCPHPNAPVLPPCRHQREETVREMRGVPDDAAPSVCASLAVDLRQQRQKDTDDPLCCSDDPAQSLSLFCSVVPAPGSDAVGEDTLNGAAVEYSHG